MSSTIGTRQVGAARNIAALTSKTGQGGEKTGNGRGFNEVLSLLQGRTGIVDTWRTETPGPRLPDTSMTGTISTFQVFSVLSLRSETAFQPAAATCEAGFFCLDFRMGRENARRRWSAVPGMGP
ncbi:hypothetical protein O0880_08160 [Janthinobacterium sp. SUN118]|uniref:hypothetical protein n=1 Tax=Janthinobacterium sp. SUN118 TaxID=3004100 RepID=UPI0025B06243|nr:hypothetical protein [Janthinobacterium sp. SUN118]MDN2709394.1 hypothetical protein [Janthinobacterium sp. SUN118]